MSDTRTEHDYRIDPDHLRRRVDPGDLAFDSTAEVAPLEGTIGQPRALEAIDFGLEVPTAGYNLFLTGPPGSGRTTTLLDMLRRVAAERPPPHDWVYVHDFDRPDQPRGIRLPAGGARRLERDVDHFLEDVHREVSRAFEGEAYDERRREALGGFEQQRGEAMRQLEAFASERGFGLQATQAGIVAFPVSEGQPIPPQELQQLSAEQRQDIDRRGHEIEEEIQAVRQRIRQLEREAQERGRRLDREVALFAVDPLVRELRQRHADQPQVVEHIDRIREDIPEHLPDFQGAASDGQHEQAPPALQQAARRAEHLDRYRINVLVDNGGSTGAPVVLERNPTYYNLVGRVEYRSAMGGMVTDFRQVKSGALHRANGGFLVLEALELLRNPLAWEALKRALRQREVRIENLVEQFALLPTATISPQAIALDVKVVLVGQPQLYQLLQQGDEDFRELFKVKADFAPDMDWTEENAQGYAAFVSRCVRESGLRHLDRSALARLVEHGSRIREHQGKLSTRLQEIADIVSEASFWAAKAQHDPVRREDVDRAIEQRERRSSLPEDRLSELIAERTIRIETEGERVGQVNGLSILDLGDYRFGLPSRVTARASIGRGGVASIERETELSGRIHSKGVLVLSGYLAQKYAQDWPLALRATLTFEQSYEEVDGDSASSTELYALLSTLSGLPVRQSMAVTGSVDQHGEVQAVGGVTRKVEGFFAICQARGLTGDQGVLVPAANVRHLTLRDDVVDAVRQGRFHVWAVSNIDEGLRLLIGREAGNAADGEPYPEGTVHRQVADRLRHYAQRLANLDSLPDGPAPQ
ncbi:MAG: AAA family ATPase [Candidatus Dormibacteraeota bacterium]|nr:AAA family ATPase [Candidatus Dormibacteraeota bacterium]MBO0760843.1 AAA family ATPase [Candidatus Dormibacteraeota bacterium]